MHTILNDSTYFTVKMQIKINQYKPDGVFLDNISIKTLAYIHQPHTANTGTYVMVTANDKNI